MTLLYLLMAMRTAFWFSALPEPDFHWRRHSRHGQEQQQEHDEQLKCSAQAVAPAVPVLV
jgi:hypothetical protein